MPNNPAALAHPSRSHRSEEHTSELQSRQYLVCRLLLEKKRTLHSTAATTTGSMPSTICRKHVSRFVDSCTCPILDSSAGTTPYAVAADSSDIMEPLQTI